MNGAAQFVHHKSGTAISSSFDAGLPANVDAEKVILGAILLDNAAHGEASEKISADDFSLDSHQRIFLRMTDLVNAGRAVDIVTLAEELHGNKEVESVGGVAYLASLTEGLPRRPVIEEYIRIVKDKKLLRRLMAVASGLVARAADQSESALEVAGCGILEISAIVESGSRKDEVFTAATLCEEAEYRLIDRPEESQVIPTGLLDESTGGGVRLGELWTIGAAPGRGKTSFGRQVAKNAIERGIPVYVHSGEMTAASWSDVTACLIEDLPAWRIREPRLMNLAEREQLRSGLRKLAQMPLFVSDSGGIHIDRLIWNAVRMKQKHGIKLLVVDYAQIIHAPGRDPREQVTNVAQRLRRFAKDENVATLLLSQSPRPEGRNINARPTMYSLKESGALEEASHTVCLLYRPMNPEDGQFAGEDEVIIAKQRWGPIGHVNVTFNGKHLRFEPR